MFLALCRSVRASLLPPPSLFKPLGALQRWTHTSAPKTNFVLNNFNFSPNKEREMQAAQRALKDLKFKKIEISRGSVIGEQDWIKTLLSRISRNRPSEFLIIGKTDQFITPKTEVLIGPTQRKVEEICSSIKERSSRSQEYRFSKIKLSPNMIKTLSELMASASHAMSFRLIIKK